MNLKYRVNTEQKVNNFPKIQPEEKCSRQLDNRNRLKLYDDNSVG